MWNSLISDFMTDHLVSIAFGIGILINLVYLLYKKSFFDQNLLGNDDEASSKIREWVEKRDQIKDFGGITSWGRWNQTNQEVDVFVHFPKDVVSKDIDFEVKTSFIRVGLRGQDPILEGKLCHLVIPEECSWQLETPDDDKTKKILWITLYKANRTEKNQHWKSVIANEDEIDTSRFGPPIYTIPSDTKDELKATLKHLR